MTADLFSPEDILDEMAAEGVRPAPRTPTPRSFKIAMGVLLAVLVLVLVVFLGWQVFGRRSATPPLQETPAPAVVTEEATTLEPVVIEEETTPEVVLTPETTPIPVVTEEVAPTPVAISKWQPVIDATKAMSIAQNMPDGVGLPVHSDSAPNDLCQYWLPPESAVADDVGPNSGGEYIAENTYRWTTDKVRALAADGSVPTGQGTTLVLEAVLVKVTFANGGESIYRPPEGLDGVFVVVPTEQVTSFVLTSGAWFAVRSLEDVDPFVSVRVAHVRCRATNNEVIDLR